LNIEKANGMLCWKSRFCRGTGTKMLRGQYRYEQTVTSLHRIVSTQRDHILSCIQRSHIILYSMLVRSFWYPSTWTFSHLIQWPLTGRMFFSFRDSDMYKWYWSSIS
jgi:hypothetical protein